MTDSQLNYDNLLTMGPYRTFDQIVLTSGGSVVRGELIALNTSTGKLVSYVEGGSNGTGDFYGIATGDVDASAGDTRCPIYVGGGFSQNHIVFGTSGDTFTEALRTQARERGCFIENTVKEDGSL